MISEARSPRPPDGRTHGQHSNDCYEFRSSGCGTAEKLDFGQRWSAWGAQRTFADFYYRQKERNPPNGGAQIMKTAIYKETGEAAGTVELSCRRLRRWTGRA